MTAPTPNQTPRAPRPALLRATAVLTLVLLAGCSVLRPDPEDRATIYAPDPRVTAAADWPSVDWQLALAGTAAPHMIDSLRIAVRPQPNELQVYSGAQWAKPPSAMVEDALLRTLEDSGRIPAVARRGAGIGADYRLVLDLRRFESDYAGGDTPAATIELNAKLLHAPDQRVVAARTFRQVQPAASEELDDVVMAFETGLQGLTGELAGWVLRSGQQHEQTAHSAAHPSPRPSPRP